MNRHLYFAYGANTNHSAMACRCPGAEFLGTGHNFGHRLVFRGVADIEEHPHGIVAGALWRISDDHLAELDRFEGYPKLYLRKPLHVRITTPMQSLGPDVTAIVYQMTKRNQHSIRPAFPMYLETLAEGYADCFLPKNQLVSATQHAYKAPPHSWDRRRSVNWDQED